MVKSLDEHIDEMRAAAEQLVKYSFPQKSRREDDAIDCLKHRTICVDGYHVAAHFNKSDYDVCKIESLELLNLYAPFLPTYVVFKLATRFLGSHELKYTETFRMGRKIYIWIVGIDDRGRPIKLLNADVCSRFYTEFGYENIIKELN